jgi:ribose 5-phosphate isomerase
MEYTNSGEVIADTATGVSKALALLVKLLEGSGVVEQGTYQDALDSLINDPDAGHGTIEISMLKGNATLLGPIDDPSS